MRIKLVNIHIIFDAEMFYEPAPANKGGVLSVKIARGDGVRLVA